MYHRVRRKMRLVVCAILILVSISQAAIIADITVTEKTLSTKPVEDNYENNVIDFDDEYSVKFNQRYGAIPWHSTSDKSSKESHRYTIVKDEFVTKTEDDKNKTETSPTVSSAVLHESTTETDFSVIPLELVSTTDNYLLSIIESTTEDDLSVIPLYTTVRDVPNIQINETATLPTSTQEFDTTTDLTNDSETITEFNLNVTTIKVQTTTVPNINTTNIDISSNKSEYIKFEATTTTNENKSIEVTKAEMRTSLHFKMRKDNTTEEADELSKIHKIQNVTAKMNFTEITTVKTNSLNISEDHENTSTTIKPHIALDRSFTANDTEVLKANSSKQIENVTLFDVDSIEVDEKDVPVFTELDAEEEEVPEDYYDGKDVVPTTVPKTNALSVLVGLAGSVVESVVESVAERVVPKGIYDLFKRMQKQSEALEGERLRSREENGGLGQFGRGILKSISSGLSKPLSQLMAGAKDIGSLDTDRGFISSVASGVSSVASVANSLGDAFKDRVQAIYPGTVWCGDGHSPTARSGELGLFFFTDTCCRQHDACKIYIKSGDTKYGLTNTGLFTRSHCSCDAKFRDCLRRTSSLVSAQIGLTYFNVLGPQCFRRAHPIVKCLKRTRITGQKCEEYEFDYTKPKMWQWFDNETF